MKNLIIYIFLVTSIGSFSQNFFKNRFAFDYTSTFNYSNNLTSNFTKANLLKEYFDNDLNISIRMTRKVSVELLTGYKTYDYIYNHYEYNDITNTQTNYKYDLSFNEVTYGLGVNFFYGRNYAPIGNSIGFFYKVNNYLVDDYNLFYAFLRKVPSDSYETSTVINYQVSSFGFKVNFVAMLSDKFPLFLKYGGTLSVPISSEIFDASYKKGSFTEYKNGLQDNQLLNHFAKKEYYKLYFGIGFML